MRDTIQPGDWIPINQAQAIFKQLTQSNKLNLLTTFDEVCLIGCSNLKAATIAGLIYFSIEK